MDKHRPAQQGSVRRVGGCRAPLRRPLRSCHRPPPAHRKLATPSSRAGDARRARCELVPRESCSVLSLFASGFTKTKRKKNPNPKNPNFFPPPLPLPTLPVRVGQASPPPPRVRSSAEPPLRAAPPAPHFLPAAAGGPGPSPGPGRRAGRYQVARLGGSAGGERASPTRGGRGAAARCAPPPPPPGAPAAPPGKLSSVPRSPWSLGDRSFLPLPPMRLPLISSFPPRSPPLRRRAARPGAAAEL